MPLCSTLLPPLPATRPLLITPFTLPLRRRCFRTIGCHCKASCFQGNCNKTFPMFWCSSTVCLLLKELYREYFLCLWYIYITGSMHIHSHILRWGELENLFLPQYCHLFVRLSWQVVFSKLCFHGHLPPSCCEVLTRYDDTGSLIYRKHDNVWKKL